MPTSLYNIPMGVMKPIPPPTPPPSPGTYPKPWEPPIPGPHPVITGPGGGGPPMPEYEPRGGGGPVSGSGGVETVPQEPPPTSPPAETWKQRGWVNADGTVTLPWGEVVSLTAAMNMYYKDRKPTGDEVPPWVLGSWNQATGTANRQFQFAPSWFSSAMQNLYNQTYSNSVRAGQPPVQIGGSMVGVDYWKQNGWVGPDNKVTLPTGQVVTLTEAMNMYYKDRKPGANEIPLWARAQTSPIQYINSIPAHLRGLYEQLLNQAYPAGSANRPAVSYMQGQAAFR